MEGEVQDSVWPLPKFYFKVQIGSHANAVHFQEVSGLDIEPQIIEYRHGNSKLFSTIKMPEISKTGTVTLKKGVFVNNTIFWDWYNALKMNTLKRETYTIHLLDETLKPTMTWELSNALPVKITGTDMKSDNNEIAIETLELVYEAIIVRN